MDEQTVRLEVGIGIFGNQTTGVEVDNLALRRRPTWLSRVRRDIPALGASLFIIGLIGYELGRGLWPWPPFWQIIWNKQSQLAGNRDISPKA